MVNRNRLAALAGGLLTLLLASVAPAALAAPPPMGEAHTFLDPVFRGTIICDTMEAVEHIATADAPDEIYRHYRTMANSLDEPVCMAIVPTGIVVDVVALGVMQRNGSSFNAWAVETLINETRVFALYLERIEQTRA